MHKAERRKRQQRAKVTRRKLAAQGGRAVDVNVTLRLLELRAKACTDKGYPKQKWVLFCETLLDLGYTLTLYEAKRTRSKYITISRAGDGRSYKVRFSDHAPNATREERGDCDFFVGKTNFTVTTTAMALEAVRKFFDVIP